MFLNSSFAREIINRDVDIVNELQLDDKIAIDRLKNRLVCLDCKNVYSASSCKSEGALVCMKFKSTRLERRIDDSHLSVIDRRISEYHTQIKDLGEYYKDKLLTVNTNLDSDKTRD